MALAKDKAALFGKGTGSAPARPSAPVVPSAAAATRPPAGTTAAVSTSSSAAAPPRISGIPSLPPHIRESKLAEARTLSDKGMTALKTSVRTNDNWFDVLILYEIYST
jgi:hypothetical protein